MKHIASLFATAAVCLCAVCFVACDKNNPLAPNKDNPVETGLKSADFDVVLLDHEKGFEKDSLYVFEGEWKEDAFYFGYWKLDPMVPNILPDGQNQIEFRISSDVTGFEGVNASSSSRCINIVQDGADHTRYHLEWVSEGESTITFWNGDGVTRKEISFTATSKSVIPLEGLLARIDGKEYKFLDSHNASATNYRKLLKTFKSRNDFPGWDKMHILEIVGPIPLNATPESDKKFALMSEFELAYLDDEGNGYDWDVYSANDEVRSKRVNDPEIETMRFPDYRWFDEEHMIGDPRGKDPFKFVPADFRERRLMLWSVKTAYKTYGYVKLSVEWDKTDGSYEYYVLNVN